MKFLLLIFFIGTFILLSCGKRENDNPIKTGLIYDTIFPKEYLPVYPGSYWKYIDEKGDTIISKTSESYYLDYYEYSAKGFISDSFYITFLDHIPIWGYEAHTGYISHAGSYPFTLILNDTADVGYNWTTYYWTGIEKRRIIIAKDTTIRLRTNLIFDSVIIVKEYLSQPANVPESWYKRYYAKKVGLIKEEYWFSYDSTYRNKELCEFKINK